MASNSTLTLDQPVARISRTALVATIWTLASLALLFLLARITNNLYAFRRLQVADGFAISSLAILIANGAVMTAMAPPMYELLAVSVGREQPTEAFLVRASYYLKLQFASTVLFWACLWSVKASFLAFFRQLTEQLVWPRRAWWVVTIFTTLAFIGSIITYPVSCTSFVLGACQTPGHVARSLISLRFSTAVDIMTDVFIIALPISIVARVQISNLQKLGLLGVLGLGIFIMGFAIARIIVTNKQGQHPEISWLALWSSIESSVAVIVCRLASFKTLFTAQKQQGSRQTYSQQGSKRGKIGSSAGRTLGSTAGRSRAKSIPLMSVRTAAPGDAQEAWMDDSSSQQEVLGDPLIHAK